MQEPDFLIKYGLNGEKGLVFQITLSLDIVFPQGIWSPLLGLKHILKWKETIKCNSIKKDRILSPE